MILAKKQKYHTVLLISTVQCNVLGSNTIIWTPQLYLCIQEENCPLDLKTSECTVKALMIEKQILTEKIIWKLRLAETASLVGTVQCSSYTTSINFRPSCIWYIFISLLTLSLSTM